MLFICQNFKILNFGTICAEETWFDGDSSTTSSVSSYVYFAGGHDFLLYEGSYFITVHCGGHFVDWLHLQNAIHLIGKGS